FELRSRCQCGIDGGMQWPATRVRLVAQLLAAESRAQVAEQQGGIAPVGLVELEEPETATKNVLCPGEAGVRQDRREHTGACRLAGLHPFGQCAVENALAIAGGVAIGDAKGGQHMLRREADQLPGCRGSAEYADHCGAVPTPVERARERNTA